MNAVILAAGMGKRLGELTEHHTKCMVQINGEMLIDRMLTCLSELALNKVVLVIGYQGQKLRDYIGSTYKGLPVEYIENPVYDQTNNIYSLYLARKILSDDDTLLMESDLIFDVEILRKLMDSDSPNLVTVAKYENWMDGTVVKLSEQGKILDFISRDSFCFGDTQSYYKTVNIYRFSKAFFCRYYSPFLKAYIRSLGYNAYYEEALRVITSLDNIPLKALVLDREKWYEIDDAQDREIAEVLFADKERKLSLIQKRYGGYWRFPNLLDFCYLVNPFYPPQRLKSEMTSSFDTLLSAYPSGMEVNISLLAKIHKVRSEFICPGNGAAELIKIMMECMPGKWGMVCPTFEEYINRMETQSVVFFVPTNPDFHYTASELISFFAQKDLDVLLLINPDNPSGNYIPQEDLLRLIAWGADRSVQIVLDESFIDFCTDSPKSSLITNELLTRYRNLVVVKSLSKSHGVAGLRLGFVASADTLLIQSLRKKTPIWNINSFAEFYLQIFGKYEREYEIACKQISDERILFYNLLSQISFLRVIPSQANFFLCEVIDTYTGTELLEKLLFEHSIFIKSCKGKKGFEIKENYIRIAIRSNEDNQKLIGVLKKLDS